MNEIELVQLPNGIESFLSTLKPSTATKWDSVSGQYEINTDTEVVERHKAGCELVKDSLRDIYSFGETIARGTPKFCLSLRRVFENLKYVEDENGKQYAYRLVELNVKPAMNENGQCGSNFTKLVGELGLSSTAAYRYKDLGSFVDEKTGEWLTEFKGYSISLLSEIWTFASKNYLTYDVKKLAKIIPADTTIDTMRQFVKVWKLWDHHKEPFDVWENYKKIVRDTPLPQFMKIYNKLLREQEKQKEKPATEYPGQLPGQTAMVLEEVRQDPEEAIPDIGNDIEVENSVSEEQAAQLTDSELTEACLKLERFNYIKFPIYEAYSYELSMSEFKEIVRKAYGNFYIGTIFEGYYFSSDANPNSGLDSGLTIGRHKGGKNVLSWGSVAGRISRLIQADNYLTAEEKESYLKWKTGRDGIEVEAPDEEPAELEEVIPEVGEVIDIEDEPAPLQFTNREYLATLPDEQFVFELCRKIIGIFPLNGKSAAFMSTVKSKLMEWLQESHEVPDNE